MDITEILPSLRSSSDSGKGWSYWRSFLNCPLRYKLDHQTETTDEPLIIGTIFHALMEHYYQSPHLPVLQMPTGPQDDALEEALRLFRAYRGRFPTTELGRTEGTEVLLKIDEPLPSFGGVSPLTARLDLVVELGAEEIEHLQHTRNIFLPEPGIYIVDHKSEGARRRNIVDKYAASIQLMLYQMMWNALHPLRKAKGALVNIIYKTKEVGFQLIYLPAVTPQQEKVVRSALSTAQLLKEEHGEERTNPERCFDYFKTCPHLYSGACERTW